MVWILTREHNQYDQYGEYFVAVFGEKPTFEKLKSTLRAEDKHLFSDEVVQHILDGGGRQDIEDIWYFLTETALR